jgi:hypothetical protein
MNSRRRTVVLALVIAASSGCSLRSRWALDDPAYAAKYAGVKQTPLGKIKQAIDARHVVGGDGLYIAGGGSSGSPATSSGSIGFFKYAQPWLSAHGGFTAVGGTSDNNGFGGLELGLRAQSPSRVAPFVGVGGTAAPSWEHWTTFIGTALLYSLLGNNDNDDFDQFGNEEEDEDEEEEYEPFGNWFAAFYPEAGVHVWLNHKIRLTGSARYYFADGGDQFWYGGLTLSLFRGGRPDPEYGPYSTEQDKLVFGAETRTLNESPPFDHDWYPDIGPPANEPPRPRNPYDNIPLTRPLPPREPEPR